MKKTLTLFFMGIMSTTLLTACSIKKESYPKNTAVSIYLTRHGKTIFNTTERVQGWSDSPLTLSGIEAAKNVGKRLKGTISFDEVYSSDRGRAIETAKEISNYTNQSIKLHQDGRLREFNYGSYEGDLNENMWGDVAKAKGLKLEEFQENLAQNGLFEGIRDFTNTLSTFDYANSSKNGTYPAENFKAVSTRMKEALDDIVETAKKSHDENILVVSHGMSLIALLSTLDPNVDSEIPKTGLENASITKVVYNHGRYTIEKINDTSY